MIIQRQLGHANLGITSVYLQGIDSSEIIAAVHERPAPMNPADPRLPRRHRHTSEDAPTQRGGCIWPRLPKRHPSSMAIPERRSRSEPSQYPRQVADAIAGGVCRDLSEAIV